jgi:hypothetical protein
MLAYDLRVLVAPPDGEPFEADVVLDLPHRLRAVGLAFADEAELRASLPDDDTLAGRLLDAVDRFRLPRRCPSGSARAIIGFSYRTLTADDVVNRFPFTASWLYLVHDLLRHEITVDDSMTGDQIGGFLAQYAARSNAYREGFDHACFYLGSLSVPQAMLALREALVQKRIKLDPDECPTLDELPGGWEVKDQLAAYTDDVRDILPWSHWEETQAVAHELEVAVVSPDGSDRRRTYYGDSRLAAARAFVRELVNPADLTAFLADVLDGYPEHLPDEAVLGQLAAFGAHLNRMAAGEVLVGRCFEIDACTVELEFCDLPLVAANGGVPALDLVDHVRQTAAREAEDVAAA